MVDSKCKDSIEGLIHVLNAGRYGTFSEMETDFQYYCRRFCSDECNQSMGFSHAAEVEPNVDIRAQRFSSAFWIHL